jgi:hypothetical protein
LLSKLSDILSWYVISFVGWDFYLEFKEKKFREVDFFQIAESGALFKSLSFSSEPLK